MNYLFLLIAEFIDFITFLISLPPYITQSIANYFKAASGFYTEEEEGEDGEG